MTVRQHIASLTQTGNLLIKARHVGKYLVGSIVPGNTCRGPHKETRTITEVTPTITPKAVNPLLRGVEIIERKAKIIASNIFTITPGLPFRLSFL